MNHRKLMIMMMTGLW